MSGEYEFDPFEYAKELEAGEDLGRATSPSPGDAGRRAAWDVPA